MMNSEIVDPCVLSEAFSTYSEEELMRWGLRDGETQEVQIGSMKRVFKMKYDILKDMNKIYLVFCNPNGDGASVLWLDHHLEKGDYLLITYTVTARPGGGPGSCQIWTPSGKRLRVNLYSMAT
jgi:hypothetical protein